MRRGRPRVGVERPVDDLGHLVRGRVEHVLIGGPSLGERLAWDAAMSSLWLPVRSYVQMRLTSSRASAPIAVV